jgi:ATPase family associated with various cellular activities (AAA)
MTDDNMWSDKANKSAVKKANEFLRDVAGGRITIESAFEYREDGGIRIALPQVPNKMGLKKAANMLLAQAEAEEAMHEFTKDFECRPLDGAFAFNKVLKEVYGMTAIGKEMRSFFGSQPPEIRTVKVSPTEEVQVPFGLLQFPPLGAQFYLQERQDDDYGMAFQVYVIAKKVHELEIRGLLMLVEAYIREHSIYRNKALIGVGRVVSGTYKEPEFFNPYAIDREKVVYATDVQEALEDEVWGHIWCTELLKENGDDIGNKVLLHGENGTGKTLAAAVTAQHCLEHDWSFIQARWDEDLKHVMRFAELLGTPTVVVIEDMEKLITSNPQKMDQLLEQFDGMRTKGREVVLLMTSNHVGEIPKAMTRAGRINRMIYVSDLDKEGVEKLINVLIPEGQREELDYEALHTAYEGYAPSWIVQALKGVSKRSVIRTRELGQPLATDDFVRCANALRAAWTLHTESEDRPAKLGSLETILRDLVATELQQHFVDVSDSGDILVRD